MEKAPDMESIGDHVKVECAICGKKETLEMESAYPGIPAGNFPPGRWARVLVFGFGRLICPTCLDAPTTIRATFFKLIVVI